VDEVLIGCEDRRGKSQDQKPSRPITKQKDLAGKTIEWRVNVKEIYKKEFRRRWMTTSPRIRATCRVSPSCAIGSARIC